MYCPSRQKKKVSDIAWMPCVPAKAGTQNHKRRPQRLWTPAFAGAPVTERLSNQLLPRRRSEEHTSELQSLMRISYAVFCLKKKTQNHDRPVIHTSTTHTQPNTEIH